MGLKLAVSDLESFLGGPHQSTSLLKKEQQLIALKEIDKECSAMCSKKEASCARSPDKKLLNFIFDKFNDELASKAPIFHAVLHVSCVNSR